MVTCSFVSSFEVYDKDIQSKLQIALNKIVRENDSVDFLFPAQTFASMTVFQSFCEYTAYQTKLFHPDKKIRLCAITDLYDRDGRVPDLQQWGKRRCHIDTVTYAYYQPPAKEVITRADQIERWIVEHSDYVVCYQYPLFHENAYALEKLAESMDKQVIDLTSENTRKLIEKNCSRLSEREQQIIEMWTGGMSFVEIGRKLSVSSRRVTSIIDSAARDLKNMMPTKLNRYWHSGASCTILRLPQPTYDNMIAFSKALKALKSSSGLSGVYLPEEYAQSPYRYLIENMELGYSLDIELADFPMGKVREILSFIQNRKVTEQPPWAKSTLWLCDSDAMSKLSSKIVRAISAQGSYIVDMERYLRLIEKQKKSVISIDEAQAEMNLAYGKLESAFEAFKIKREYDGYIFLLRAVALAGQALPEKIGFTELVEKIAAEEHTKTQIVQNKLSRSISSLWRVHENWALLNGIEGEGALPANTQPIDVLYALAYYVKEYLGKEE